MPRKAHTITDEERAKRIRETAEEIGTSNDPKDFEQAFGKAVQPKLTEAPPPASVKKRKRRTKI